MKITCNIIEDLLPLYVDDMVSEDSRQLVEEHLKTCPACRKMQDERKSSDSHRERKQFDTDKQNRGRTTPKDPPKDP